MTFDEKLAAAQAAWQYDPTLTIAENMKAMYDVLDTFWPPPEADPIPQCVPLSTNTCPNAVPHHPMVPTACDLFAATSWGYCTECWSEGRVPAAWAAKVEAAIAGGVGR